MAILLESQAKQLLKQPKNSDQIAIARRLEERIKLHTEAVMDQAEMQNRFHAFKDWVTSILPPDKMEGFNTLWQAPVETNELTESIFGELSKVFQAENPSIKHTFRDSKSEEDFKEFLAEYNDEKFWTNDYWNELKGDQNSILVIDLPPIQTTPRPEPYCYILDIDHIHDLDVNKRGELEYLIFFTSENGILAVIDDVSWSRYLVPANEKGEFDFEKAVLQSVVPHNLGRVPAKPMYFQPINKGQRIVNHNPITRSLGALDWLLFFEVAKKYLETYAPFPIYATYSELEDAEAQTQTQGEEGMSTGIEHLLAPGEKVHASRDHENRNSKNRKLVGPGSIQRYDAPKDNQDSDLLSNPVQVIPAEEVSLNYCEKYVKSLNEEIFANTVGKGGDVINNQAANELQVQSTFESRINVLSGIRKRIEEARQYVYEIKAELRYGDLYIGTDVSLGDKYFLASVKEQQEELSSSRDAGLPNYELQNQIQAIFRNKYRDQPDVISRNVILSQLEPYPGLTTLELKDLVQTGIADKTKVRIKLEFDSLIKRFEREQMNIVDFASARPLQTKIDIISKKLIDYVSEQKDDSSQQEPGSGAPGTGGAGGRSLPPQN